MTTSRGDRLRLATQIPESGFPGGVRAPSAVVLVLVLLLSGFAAFQLRTTDPGAVPDEVVESQQHLVEGVARSVAASATQGVNDLATVAVLPESKPEEVLTALLASHPKWRGMALVEAESRKLVATRGEPVPVEAVPQVVTEPTVTPVVHSAGEVRMLVSYALPNRPQWVLLASSKAGIPSTPLNEDLGQGLLLTTRTGEVIDSRGTVPAPDDKSAKPVVDRAATAAGGGEAGVSVGDRARDSRAPVVAYTPVRADDLSGELGLAVVSIVHAPVSAPSSSWPGVWHAVALLAVGLLGFVLIQLTLVRPVRRLRADLLDIAGGDLKYAARRSRTWEISHIVRAVNFCRAKFRGVQPKKRKPRRGWPVIAGISLATLGLLGWSAATVLTLGRADVKVPGPVMANTRSHLGSTADAVRRSINDGFVDLRAVTAMADAKDPFGLKPTVDRLAERQDRYRSVYVIDKTGNRLVSAGREALRPQGGITGEGGVRLADTSGRVPVLFAHAPLPDGKHTLVAEFDVDHIATLLRRSQGQARLVDTEMRTIAATHGYIAFEQITAQHLKTGLTAAFAGTPTATVVDAGGDRAIVAARAIDGTGTAATLKWAVVSEQPVTGLSLIGNEIRRAALVVALISVTLALLLFGWHYLVLVRPLRKAAVAADRLANGDTKAVIYPVRQDEIGTITSCLEICRQALTDGVGRLGAVRRPTGAATDATVLMKPVGTGR